MFVAASVLEPAATLVEVVRVGRRSACGVALGVVPFVRRAASGSDRAEGGSANDNGVEQAGGHDERRVRESETVEASEPRAKEKAPGDSRGPILPLIGSFHHVAKEDQAGPPASTWMQ